MEYKVGDLVVHCRDGVSRITGTKVFDDKEYYCIQTDNGQGDIIYVLVDNTSTLIRPLMDRSLAKIIIDEMKDIQTESFSNTKQRRDNYHRRLSSGNPRDLAFLTKQLFLFKKAMEDGNPIKLGPSDVSVLEAAKAMFYKELSICFNIDIAKVDKLF